MSSVTDNALITPYGQVQPEGGILTLATLAQILQLSQMGNGGLVTYGGGIVNTQLSAAGLNPAATGADKVVMAFTIPANSFDSAFRGLYMYAVGSFANNGNHKRVKIIVNPATAVVGQTVGANGTTLVDTGDFSTAAATPIIIEGQVIKYGAAGSNTQLAIALGSILGTTHGGVGGGTAIQTMTAIENAPILVAVTANATTTATDISLNLFQAQALN
jgi:hypothetical protein